MAVQERIKRSEVSAAVSAEEKKPGLHPMTWVVFISLLLDLISFTMILPLLPSLLESYKEQDSSGLYGLLEDVIGGFQRFLGSPSSFNNVLFGGAIGSMSSTLQFLVFPIVGALSDVFGRRPVILVCMVGMLCSYCVWFMASSFSLFILSRIISGLSRSNVTLSTAIITDVSSPKTRGKGMALIGVAFSIGFTVGPMIGAFMARSSNFTFPALVAIVLIIVDILYVLVFFKETLPKENRADSVAESLGQAWDYLNIRSIFNFSAVRRIDPASLHKLCRLGRIYFLYLFLYSGLEFTLSFLTHMRFQYSSMQQGKMFLLLGVTMMLVQGGYVRRVPPGKEKRTALTGLCVLVPSFLLIGLCTSTVFFYIGLVLYAFGSATAVPCLTTIVSHFGDKDQKGTVMGIFRSLGALARALGPLFAASMYWCVGPEICYTVGGILLVIPYILLKKTDV